MQRADTLRLALPRHCTRTITSILMKMYGREEKEDTLPVGWTVRNRCRRVAVPHLPLAGEAGEAVAVALVAAVAAVLRGVAEVRRVDAASVVALELSRPATEGGARRRLVGSVAAIVLKC